MVLPLSSSFFRNQVSAIFGKIHEIGEGSASYISSIFEEKGTPEAFIKNFSSASKRLIKEIDKEERRCCDNLVAIKLAKRISDLACKLLQIKENETTADLITNKTLFSVHKLAESLKKTHKLQGKIWKKLHPDAKKLFNATLPFISPPVQNAKKISENTLAGNLYLNTSDKRGFYTGGLSEERVGTRIYPLVDYPDYALHVIDSLPTIMLDKVKDYLSWMPSNIYNVFDIHPLEKQIHPLKNMPYIQLELSKKAYHQLFVLKCAYMERILEALGVAVDPLANISPKGLWLIKKMRQTTLLTKDSLGNLTPEESEEAASNIAHFFELERKFGIDLLGGSLSKAEEFFYLEDKTNVYLRFPKASFNFLDDKIEERHALIKSHFEKHLPQDFIDKIFAPSLIDTKEKEKILFLLDLLKEKGYLKIEDLFFQKENAEVFLNALKGNSFILNAPEKVPFSKFLEPEQLILYFSFCKVLLDPNLFESSKDHIETLLLKLIHNIPSEEEHFFDDNESFRKHLPKIIEKDLSLRALLPPFVIKYLFDCFSQNPELPLNFHFNHLRQTINSSLEKTLYTKTHFPKKDAEGRKEYLNCIFWDHILEDINTLMFPPTEALSLEDKLLLLRSLYKSSDKNKIRERLFEILHHQMLIKNKDLSASYLRKQVAQIKSESFPL